MSRRPALAAGLACVLLLLPACGQAAAKRTPSRRTLVVFAAASLRESFTTLAHQFEAKHPGVRVALNFAGSDTLAASITAGAPVDVFAAASPKTLGIVTTAGHGVGQPVTLARNQLAIAVPKGNPQHVASLRDTTRPGTKLVLCAATVPCGAAAQKAYAAAGVKPRPVSLELDVKSVLTKVELGEADAGLVYRTDVLAAGAKVVGIAFPESVSAISAYPIVGVDTGKDAGDGKAFISYVLSAAGRRVLTAHGFLPP